MDSGSPRGSGDALHGLKFGQKIYFKDGGGRESGSSSMPPPSPEKVAAATARKAKGVAQGGQLPPAPPRCQVEGCNADLTGAKPYYCRHKVCCMHSKAPKVVVAGLEQRFCQQCSRFHQLPEFDQGKRSCRRRLAGHNERRRKPSLGPFASRHAHVVSSFHDQPHHEPSRFRSFMMDFSFPNYSNRARDVWSTTRGGEHMAAGGWQGGLDAPPLAAAAAALHGGHPYFHGSLTGTFRAPIEFPPGESLTRVSDSSCALSLLSTNAWNGTSAGGHAPVAPVSRSFDCPPITHSSIGREYATSSWGFGTQGGQTSSFDIQQHEATETSGAHFSGQLEFFIHDNEACVHHNSAGAYDHSDPSMHWSL